MEPLTLPESTYLLIQKEEKKRQEMKNNVIISAILLGFLFTLVYILWLTRH